MRSTARPAPSNARTTSPTPSPRDIYNRTGRRAAPSTKVGPRDVVRDAGTRTKPRSSARVVPSRTDRYSSQPRGGTPKSIARTNNTRSGSVAPRLIPRSPSISSTVTRSAFGATSRLYGSYGFGSIYNSWWDPCYSYGYSPNYWTLHGGYGCYGFGLSLWYPWYLSTSLCWSNYYNNCWWNTVSSPYWSNYWWYPRSTYCPTYLYVPSSTVVYVDPEPAYAEEVEPEGSVVAAGSEPSDLAAKYIELGDFYFKAGRFSEAADAYARARTYAPDDAALHFVLSDAAFAVGDYHFAAFLIAEGLRLDPELAKADADKRDFYGDKKLFDEHMAALDKYLAEKRYDASAHLVRGYNLKFSKQPTAAIDAFERVLVIAPDHRAARIFLEVLKPKAKVEPTIR